MKRYLFFREFSDDGRPCVDRSYALAVHLNETGEIERDIDDWDRVVVSSSHGTSVSSYTSLIHFCEEISEKEAKQVDPKLFRYLSYLANRED